MTDFEPGLTLLNRAGPASGAGTAGDGAAGDAGVRVANKFVSLRRDSSIASSRPAVAAESGMDGTGSGEEGARFGMGWTGRAEASVEASESSGSATPKPAILTSYPLESIFCCKGNLEAEKDQSWQGESKVNIKE